MEKQLDHSLALVRDALHAARSAPHASLRATLRRFADVSAGKAAQRGLVQGQGDVLIVAPSAAQLFGDMEAQPRARAIAVAVLHEAIHVGQGIPTKRAVLALRRADGERTLLRVDVAADVAAAHAVAGASGDARRGPWCGARGALVGDRAQAFFGGPERGKKVLGSVSHAAALPRALMHAIASRGRTDPAAPKAAARLDGHTNQTTLDRRSAFLPIESLLSCHHTRPSVIETQRSPG